MEHPVIHKLDDPVFLKHFVLSSGIREVTFAYLVGSFGSAPMSNGALRQDKNAVDFKSSIGPFAQILPQIGFTTCCSIASSDSLLESAIKDAPPKATNNEQVFFRKNISGKLLGNTDLVTSVQAYGNCKTYEELTNSFFEPIASLLKPEGEAVIFGCPTSLMFYWSPFQIYGINYKDIPDDIKEITNEPENIKDGKGYIALFDLPYFDLKDGTEIQTTWRGCDVDNNIHVATGIIHYWSEKKLEQAAEDSGLILCRQNVLVSEVPTRIATNKLNQNYISALHFKKKSDIAPT